MLCALSAVLVQAGAPPLLGAQTEGPAWRFGGVDVYGTDDISVEQFSARFGERAHALFQAIQARDDDALDSLRSSMGPEIRSLTEVAWIDMALVYSPGDTTAYMTFDIVERSDSARRLDFAQEPQGQVEDPGGLLATWLAYEQDLLGRLMRAQQVAQPTSESCPVLHCLAAFGADPTVAEAEERFLEGVPEHLDALLRVLREDADAEDRAAATYLLAHAPEPRAVVPALVQAMRDPSSLVRNNAMRVLGMALLFRRPIDVPLEPVLRAIDLPETTGRNKALLVLQGLAQRPELRPRIAREAGPTLLRLLHLTQPNNHDPAWQILRAVSGEEHGERDYAAWEAWVREAAEALG